MPTVRQHVTNAYIEIGVLSPGQSMPAALGATGLFHFQNLLDGWQADRLSMAVQSRVTFTLTSGTSSVTIGTGGSVVTTPATTAAPVWLDTVAYVIPGSSPDIEVPVGIMPRDTYAALSIKELESALPLQCFYQLSNTTALGTLFVWPQVTQDVEMVLYAPQGVGVPATLDSVVIGPTGYADAFHYNLAWRLCTPTGTSVPDSLPSMAANATLVMQRPNMLPGLLSVDPAVAPSSGAGYNILSDVMQPSR